MPKIPTTTVPVTLRRLAAAALLPLAAACVSSGEGSLELSAKVAHAFGAYQELKYPKAFAVTTDGLAFGSVYCPYSSCSGNLQNDAVQSCTNSATRKRLTEAECRVFAVGDSVLWRGDVLIPDVAEETYYALNVAEGAELAGPESAIGAIIYVPGNNPQLDLPQDDAVVPFYIKNFANSGWDAFKLVSNNADLITHQRAALGIQARIQELRGQGYARVVLAAQSFGSWLVIYGSQDSDFGADAVIAAAPANYGAARRGDGRPNPYFQRNKTELIKLAGKFHGRLMLIFFDQDPFDPGGRANLAREALQQTGAEFHIIDRPKGFLGHGAAWLAAFDFVFGDCMKDFAQRAEIGPGFDCVTPPLGPGDHRWMTRESHLEGSPARLATAEDFERLLGNTLIGYQQNGDRADYYLRDEHTTVVQVHSGYQRTEPTEWETDYGDGTMCLAGGCFRLYVWDEDFVVVIDQAGNIAFRGEVLPGDARGLEAALAS